MTLPTSRDCRDLSSCQLSISQHSAPLAIFSRQILTCGAGLVGVKILVKVWAGGSGLCWAWLITGTTATPHHTTPLLGPPTDPYCSSELGWWQLSKFPAKVERWMRWGEVRWEQLWGKQRTSVLAGSYSTRQVSRHSPAIQPDLSSN